MPEAVATWPEGKIAADAARGGRAGWLRGPAFDLTLIVGVFALALLLGGVAWLVPALFFPILLIDLWLLAYPHVASTFTRIAFTRADRRRHRFILLGLPPLVLLGTAGVAWAGGLVALGSLYYFWQSWHYTRQSHGIARAYRRASGGVAGGARDRLSEAVVYGFPLWGVLHRAHQAPAEFYGAPLWCPPVPGVVVLVAGIFALVALALWLRRVVEGEVSRPAALFIASHVAITAIAYLLIPEITRGWLFLNIWHNAQYLLFVWAANARRFGEGGPEAAAIGPLPALSRPGRGLAYAAILVAISSAFYLALGATVDAISWSALPVLLVVHQSVNFHHYLVDMLIWRAPRQRS